MFFIRLSQLNGMNYTIPQMKTGRKDKTGFFSVRRFRELTSTNDVLKKLAEEGAPEGTVIVAQTQTRGRGRMDRTWISPRGNLYMSVLLRPDFPAKDMLKLTLLSACAAADAIEKTTALKPTLKWPNDILIRGKKVCGILCEGSFAKNALQYLIIGIGVNVNTHPKAYGNAFLIEPAALADECGKKLPLRLLEQTLLSSFLSHYRDAKKRGLFTALEKWSARPSTLHKEVRVKTSLREITGKAVDLDANGFLIVQAKDGKKVRIMEGDVAHLS